MFVVAFLSLLAYITACTDIINRAALCDMYIRSACYTKHCSSSRIRVVEYTARLVHALYTLLYIALRSYTLLYAALFYIVIRCALLHDVYNVYIVYIVIRCASLVWVNA